ncbi:ECF RNA polymerase sigma factor SigW [Calycomorphotria hydatis]|uniref:ECF RNA polymerase sigma factor SigW n=1 Tax=Calycomorphotria hydatis TaxID=2528027 RepID=A0A517TB50_9PLAN|nr:ECF RNA polymerase sigma factor SigW [Calycomorphotria hydatis]
MEAADDPNLFSRIIAGDENALAELFSQYRSRLWRIVNFRIDPRLVGRVDPDDILQESWMNSAQRIDSFPKESSLSSFVWFRLIVNQTLIDVHRRHLSAQKRSAAKERSTTSGWSASSTTFSLSSHLLGHQTSPSEAAIREENAKMIDATLKDMSDVDREVLALRHFEELTNRETAEVLGMTEQAASVRYVRALKRLQQQLNSLPGFLS